MMRGVVQGAHQSPDVAAIGCGAMLPVLLVVPSLLAAAPAAPVTLRFAWPANLTGSIKNTWVLQRGPKQPPEQHEMASRFTVQEVKKGLRRMVSSDTGASKGGDVSSLLFDDRGAFKGLEHQGDMLDRIDGPLPVPPEKRAELRAQLEAMMTGTVKEKWDEHTGRWDGVTLTPGKPSRRTVKLRLGPSSGASPPGEQAEVDANEITTLETDVACEAAARKKACVRLTVETTPARPLQGKPDETGAVEKEVTKRVVLVLEPATLVPYSFHDERTRVLQKDGQAERHSETNDTTFSYGPPGPRKP
jgi:hypothetical protein